MKVWLISDTHGFHKELLVPECDMVIHCGDEANYSDPVFNEIESINFFDWYSSLDIEHKLFIPGNHSTAIQAGLVKPSDYPDVEFLIHDLIKIDDIKIFGSPYTPKYGNSWAYMKKRNKMDQVWTSVPKCDILITHGPPKGILDLTNTDEGLLHVGCKSLLNKVLEVKPKIHAFGHIHDETENHNFGQFTRWGTQFMNCASWSHRKKDINNGHVVELS